MAHGEPARTTTRRAPRIRLAALLVVIGALAAALAYQSLASPSATVPSSRSKAAPPRGVVPDEHSGPRGEHRGALGEADGAVPEGATVFDDEIQGVANLDADLLSTLRRAATDAADDGIELVVDSGWRSPAYQEQLLREAVSKYGSREEAARWVASPETSAHVSGDAVDVGSDGATWLSEHGAGYGLCQVYRNESWHFELRPEAIDRGCPPMYADPTQDPRMQHSDNRGRHGPEARLVPASPVAQTDR